jgi:hypothetical protein
MIRRVASFLATVLVLFAAATATGCPDAWMKSEAQVVGVSAEGWFVYTRRVIASEFNRTGESLWVFDARGEPLASMKLEDHAAGVWQVDTRHRRLAFLSAHEGRKSSTAEVVAAIRRLIPLQPLRPGPLARLDPGPHECPNVAVDARAFGGATYVPVLMQQSRGDGLYGGCESRGLASFVHPDSPLIFLWYDASQGRGLDDSEVRDVTWFPQARVRGAALWHRGRQALARNAFGAAIDLFEQALALAPELQQARDDIRTARYQSGATSTKPYLRESELLRAPGKPNFSAYYLVRDDLRRWPDREANETVTPPADLLATQVADRQASPADPETEQASLGASSSAAVEPEVAGSVASSRSLEGDDDDAPDFAHWLVTLLVFGMLGGVAWIGHALAFSRRLGEWTRVWWWEQRLLRAIRRHVRHTPEARPGRPATPARELYGKRCAARGVIGLPSPTARRIVRGTRSR